MSRTSAFLVDEDAAGWMKHLPQDHAQAIQGHSSNSLMCLIGRMVGKSFALKLQTLLRSVCARE
jgi:hypothetical protein